MAKAETRTREALRIRPWLVALAGLGALLVAGQRIWIAHVEPLWLDEAWTGAIVSATGWTAFWREVWLDVNAPLYYLLMRLWTSVFGLSDLALKAPGLLAVLAAALVPLLIRLRGLSPEARIAWAALIFFWWGVDIFLDARCYGLLLALSALQCVIFGRLLVNPSLAGALAWALVGAAASLTQYYAILAVAAQGAIYLAVHRGRALRTWPAALAFLPTAAWIAWHAPRLVQYADPALAWHPAVDGRLAVELAGFPVIPAGPVFVLAAGLILAGMLLAGRLRPGMPRDEPVQPSAHLWWVAASGVLATALALATGAWRETLTARYLIPAVPAILLGVVLIARAAPRAHLAYLLLTALYLGAAIDTAGTALDPNRIVYGHQRASDALMRQGVSQVVFVWDHEATRIMDEGSLRRLGGFFFRRDGYPVTVTALKTTPASDVNRLALEAARGPRPGIIWIFNRGGRTAARARPPRIAELDPAWSCDRLHNGTYGAVACWRRAPTLMVPSDSHGSFMPSAEGSRRP